MDAYRSNDNAPSPLFLSFRWQTATFYFGIGASIGLVLAVSITDVPKTSGKIPTNETTVVE